ncbi:preprotein translocase subunit SecE [Candidatus Peregrinibacteria bacterium]|nr:preprotein translocase subunit SecE [Candidatus Peregrinibacteria bacterium]
MDALQNYIREALEELRLVRWPTRQQAVRLSAIVLGFTGVSAAIFGLLDFAFAQGIRLLLSFTL